MKILFVCKHNRFRSKVAESIFNKLNKNFKIKAESAGLLIDELRPYICENVLNIMKEKGYSVSDLPKRITKNQVDDADLIIIVANNVDKNFFHDFSGKIRKWKISDTDESDERGIRQRIEDIEKRVKKLIASLE